MVKPTPDKKPRILFIALAQSTHTHSWVGLLRDQAFDVRVFGITDTRAPNHFTVPTYSLSRCYPSLSPDRHLFFEKKGLCIKGIEFLLGKKEYWLEEKWLARIIKKWQPDIIHTLGLDPASFSYYRVRENYDLKKMGVWVVTARGGPELSLKRLIPEEAERIGKVFQGCDQFVADNHLNYEYALDLGLDPSKLSALGVVPGTGGVDVEGLSKLGESMPSQRKRIILWPKAYECPASKALPVFEALRICWEKIKPCELHMTAMIPETRMWLQTLPAEIRNSSYGYDRIPQKDVVELMSRSRVMLAPSLTDGIPNTLYEAMASGAFPIVSPLETFNGVIHDGQHALFARNLYPAEIADALIRAMSDDELVDSAVVNNRETVKQLASRDFIAGKVAKYYHTLLQGA